MAILINNRKGPYINNDVYVNAVNYCAKCNIYGGHGFSSDEPEIAEREFQMVPKLYGIFGGKMLNHAILSFDSACEVISIDTAVAIAYEVSAYFADRFQVYYGIHTDTDNLHIHIFWSNISYLNGEPLKDPDKQLAKFRKHTKKALARYGIVLK